MSGFLLQTTWLPTPVGMSLKDLSIENLISPRIKPTEISCPRGSEISSPAGDSAETLPTAEHPQICWELRPEMTEVIDVFRKEEDVIWKDYYKNKNNKEKF